MKQKTVLLGLSGGVDSSVAALLLKKQGYRVIGAFMKNFSDTKNALTGECNYLQEKRMAQKISALLKIPLITIDREKQYKSKVINPMFQDYKKGLTPNPDTLCNKLIKFPALWKTARSLKADYIATGHYARIKKTLRAQSSRAGESYQLLSGKDKTKDQSYFLYQLTQKDLSHTLFPIGDLTKSQVRTLAKKNKFPNWDKPGTRGVCFIGKIDFKVFLKKKIKPSPGPIKNPEGEIIGIHPGVQYFTIGERVGPRYGMEIKKQYKNLVKTKLYIAEKKKPNTLIIAPQNSALLKKSRMLIRNFHQINPNTKIPKTNLKARIRHLAPLIPCTFTMARRPEIILKKPTEAIAEGQAVVLYRKNKVIGGGEIRY